MKPLILLSPSLYISLGLHVRLSTARKGHPSELCFLLVGKHMLCCQIRCATERHKVYCYDPSAFSSLYFLRFTILSGMVSHLYNTRSNKRLPNQEDRAF